jgi:hypothetical protein
MCDVTDPMPTAGHTENTACSTVVDVYHVYIAVAWQRIDQICHIIIIIIIIHWQNSPF